jgi:thiazole tautomerase (transcriptional regulator TenI)
MAAPSRSDPATVPVLHVVTTDSICARGSFLDGASAILSACGERCAIHLRVREMPTRQLYELASRLVSIAAHTRGWIVINDRVDVALAAGAHGAQLGSCSIQPSDARMIEARTSRGVLRLGLSIHGNAAPPEEADWLLLGHIFPTPSHPGESGLGVQGLRQIAQGARLPVIAIGGISRHHVPSLRGAGASGVAAIRGIWDADDPAAEARQYVRAFEG